MDHIQSMEIITTILSYLFVGGIASTVTALITIKSTRRSAAANAKGQEEEAESKAIDNEEKRLSLYNKLIDDLNNRLESMMAKQTKIENENEEAFEANKQLKKQYKELESKYKELESKYKLLENKYNDLLKKLSKGGK